METFIKVLLIYNSPILGFLIILIINFLINLKNFKPISNFEFDLLYRKTLPKVSVLIPTRNESANIEKYLNSLLEQDYKNLEVLVLEEAEKTVR